MSIWDAGTISRFSEQGEDAFASAHKCLISRVALNVVAATADYALPELLLDIRRVTWKGKKLWPLPKRYMNEFFQGSQFTSNGEPTYYLYNGITLNTIRLFPTPIENLASVTTGLFGTEIPNRCIIEYFQLPDHSVKVIPEFFRRRLLKSYTLAKCFQIEGRGQNLKNAKYHAAKYEELQQIYGNLLSELYNRARRLIMTGNAGIEAYPRGTPHLSYAKYGFSVGDE